MSCFFRCGIAAVLSSSVDSCCGVVALVPLSLVGRHVLVLDGVSDGLVRCLVFVEINRSIVIPVFAFVGLSLSSPGLLRAWESWDDDGSGSRRTLSFSYFLTVQK